MLALRNTLRAIRSPVTSFISKNTFHLAAAMAANPKVAVVLAGCGVYDGSECHEASAIMVHLSRAKADMSVFAPDVDQMHVIDHTKGAPMEGQVRNVLVESARLSRVGIAALSELKADGFDAIMFPGGFGAAKNLCSFAVDNADHKVNSDVERVIKEFHAAKKPIGMVCISPVIAAKILPGVSVTVGSNEEEGGRWPYAGTAGAIEKMGGKHVKKNVTETNIDEANKVVTSPAFMCDTAIHEIHDGIGAMVKDVLKMVKK